jgi:hypothetical protein
MMALEVDDMQNTADYLRTKGVELVWGPRLRETYSRAEMRLIPLSQVVPHLAFEERRTRSGAGAGILREA